MPKTFISLGFYSAFGADRRYITDAGLFREFNGRGQLPESIDQMTVGQAQDIANAVGAQLLKLGQTVILDRSNPCPDASAGFTARRLQFILNNKQSFSVPFSPKANVLTAAQTIKDTVESVNSNVQVVCVKLIGEEIANLNDELGLNFNPDTRVASAGSSRYYAGRINYERDDNLIQPGHPVKILSALGVVPPIFANVWADCVGDFVSDTLRCGGQGRSNPLDHRRYIVNYQVEPDQANPNQGATEQREIPVRQRDSGEILACGQAIAQASTAIYCISYKGENFDRIHRLLT